MLRRLDLLPMLLAKTLEIEDRQLPRWVQRFTEQPGNLLCDRAPLAFGLGLEFLVERVRKILDIQCRHNSSNFLHYGGHVISGKVAARNIGNTGSFSGLAPLTARWQIPRTGEKLIRSIAHRTRIDEQTERCS